ncbi:winged helix-turn-helix transcriptional regulator [Paraburkholderia caribensis]|uniref:winged helix-turn-helix transcriptional regulator n=1 Tax=Paraburkholderia caribensis TaxID=75105 RepID=UPI001CB35398|nr:helix-turn-helix domain-containing protein [Paraburkholderia caribensis]CAG9249521.1 Transcriptional regulator, HxlR family [Paraburkholderia caribensis]
MKGKRTDLGTSNCSIARSLQIIGDWWSLLIVRDALMGSERFNEFQASIGLAKNILSSRLRKLVADGILSIEPDTKSPSIKRYVLTGRGRQLSVVLVALWQWGEENCFEPGELNVRIVDEKTGQPIQPLELRTDDGRLLAPAEFRMGLGSKSVSPVD